MKFAAPSATPKGFARRVPPAIFPAIMGLFGLGLAWQRAEAVLDLPAGIAGVILGAVTLLYLFALGAYLAKLLRRPAVLIEDLRILPGRLGVSAMMACLYLVAISLAPHAPDLARGLLQVALGLHAGIILLLGWSFLRGPAEQRRYSPAGHLYFVSPIIGANAAALAGFDYLALGLLAATLLTAALIWAWGADRLWRDGMAAPLRPLLALHLAPAALTGLTAQALGLQNLSLVAAAAAAMTLGGLILGLRPLTVSGFSPLWAAFTFPLAATASLFLVLGGAWQIAGLLILAVATLIIPAITFRVMKLWAGGQLAIRTNAASA